MKKESLLYSFFGLYPKFPTVKTSQNQANNWTESYLQRAKFCCNLTWKIQIADGEENHIDKRGQTSKPTGAIFHQPDDSVQAFGFCIRDGLIDKGQNPMQMFSEHSDEISDGQQAAF